MAINPVSVANAFLIKVKFEFCECPQHEDPSNEEKQIADMLFTKFEKISTEYQFVEEYENDLVPAEPSQRSSQSQPFSQSQSSRKGKGRKKTRVSVEQKRKILKFIDENPGSKFKAIRRRFPAYKDYNYAAKWRKQVADGGSAHEIYEKINSSVIEKFHEVRGCFKPVHDRDLKTWTLQKALEFPSMRGNFAAGHTWLTDLKKKHRISSRKVTKLVSKRQMENQGEILKIAEEFRQRIRQLKDRFHPSEIWNTDQIGFNYEYFSNRTLSYTGERYTFGSAFSPKNRMTHSYTVQYTINAEGCIVGNVFICLQEPNGRLGDRVKKDMFVAPNITVTCSNSGKLTGTHVKYFVENVLQPVMKDKVLYILDSWTGHVNEKIYSEASGMDDVDFNLRIIPPNCTPIIQPSDVFFNLQLKFFIKRIYDQGHVLNIQLTSRNDVLKMHSLVHFFLSADCFKSMIKYSWLKAGLIENEECCFKTVKEQCFTFVDNNCGFNSCANTPFIKCSWCNKVMCFSHFYECMHIFECDASPYKTNVE